MKNTCISIIFLAAAFAIANAAHAQQFCRQNVPDSTPNIRYEVNVDEATVFDKQTGLTWQQCSLGQSAVGGTCSGTVSSYTWQGALQIAESTSGWRLPNKKELQSLVAFHCYRPSINISIFPSTNDSYYWSSSPKVSSTSFLDAWYVDFSRGNDDASGRSGNYSVRLVR